MIPVAAGVRIWIASGHTDMRKGMNGLALLVQEGLGRDPFAGDVFVFRGRAGSLIKALWHDGGSASEISCASLASAKTSSRITRIVT
jgi:transposase